jgi:hypothetical protein
VSSNPQRARSVPSRLDASTEFLSAPLALVKKTPAGRFSEDHGTLLQPDSVRTYQDSSEGGDGHSPSPSLRSRTVETSIQARPTIEHRR